MRTVSAGKEITHATPSRRVTILFVIGQLEIGGTEKHLLKILPALRKKGYHVELFALRDKGVLREEFLRNSVTIKSSMLKFRGIFGVFFAALSLSRYLFLDKPTIVHFFLPEAYLMGGICAIPHRSMLKVMSRRSQNVYQSKHKFLSVVEKMLHRSLDFAISNSKAIGKELEAEGIPPGRLANIYNGISIDEYDLDFDVTEIRRKLSLPPEAIVVTALANLIPYKGHTKLLEALASISERLSMPWILLCIGTGQEAFKNYLVAETQRLGLDEKVRWLGSIESPREYLLASDIGVSASSEEGFSNSLLEYMASGLPVVATAVGGNVEAVVHEKTGFLVDANKSEGLAIALERLMVSDHLRNQLGKAGRERVERYFSFHTCVEEYDKVYQRLLENR